MSRLLELTKSLEEKYGFDIDDLLDLYKRKLSRREIGEKLGLSTFATRKIMEQLYLSPKKSKRAENYLKFIVEYSTEKEVANDAAELPIKENEFLSKKLATAQRTIQRSRDELTHLRKVVRDSNRSVTLREEVVKLVEEAIPVKDKRNYCAHVVEGSNIYKDYVSCLLLSDLHVEEAVSPQDVGMLNEFNWEIMEERLDKVFNTWLNMYRGEKRATIMILGDVISGVIHDTLENTTKTTAEALHDISDILSGYIKTAGVIFETVDVHFVSGNHERISERIKSSNKGMDFGYLFAQLLKAKLSDTQNVSLEISTTGFVATNVNGKWLGGHHGDNFRGAKSDARTLAVQEAFKKVLGIEVDHILEGHTHKFSYHMTNRGASIVNGSLIGSNSYGLTNGYMPVRPVQTIILFSPDGEVDLVKPVFLD